MCGSFFGDYSLFGLANPFEPNHAEEMGQPLPLAIVWKERKIYKQHQKTFAGLSKARRQSNKDSVI